MKNINRFGRSAFKIRLIILLTCIFIIISIVGGGYALFSKAKAIYEKQNVEKTEEWVTDQKKVVDNSNLDEPKITEEENLAEETSPEEVQIEETDDTIQFTYWNFENSLEEVNGLEGIIHDDVSIVDLEDIGVYQKKAAYFDGDEDYIEVGTGLNIQKECTFNFVLNCTDMNKNYSSFFAKYAVNFEGAYAFSIRQGHINCWITYQNGAYGEIESNTMLKEDEWYYISVVIEHNNLKIYINGELDIEGEIEDPVLNEDVVTIGRQAFMFEPEDQLQYTGYIGEISIYDRVLTQTEIKEMAGERIVGHSDVDSISMDMISSISATSSLSEYDMTHSPDRVFDGDLTTAWVEGVSGHGEGESLVFIFEGICLVSGVKINAGYQKNSDLYTKNSRPAIIELTYSDGRKEEYVLEDVNAQQTISLNASVETSSITLKIISVYAGWKYEDTVISEISFF